VALKLVDWLRCRTIVDECALPSLVRKVNLTLFPECAILSGTDELALGPSDVSGWHNDDQRYDCIRNIARADASGVGGIGKRYGVIEDS
jgi:hypothetical protein